MKITGIALNNVRSFKNLPKTELSKNINIFIGANNSGKSTILNSIYLLQKTVLNKTDISLGEKSSFIDLYYEGAFPPNIIDNRNFNKIRFLLNNNIATFYTPGGSQAGTFKIIPQKEPENLIYPYLSKRKTVTYVDVMNEANANAVDGNFTHLYSKIDRLSTPQFQPGHNEYTNACKSVLGFEIGTIAKGNGKQAAYFVYNLEHIPITSMGEGVVNILGLITDLCVAQDKIFLIEEPENDIHPKALKSLLEFIIEKSNSNQFFISTHSNIVMKYLGSVKDSKIFNVTNNLQHSNREKIFVSDLIEVSEKPEDRRIILEELGYEFFDFDLWKGWLFLEESSAEIIIRDYLIDWFVSPIKNKIRTFAVGGIDSLISKFEDFDRLFIFLHLEPTYKNKVWVLIDGGSKEENIIQKLKNKYIPSGWNEGNFMQFKEHDFEKYYPPDFKEKVEKVLSMESKEQKRQGKKELLNEVLIWIKSDEQNAKEKFKESAADVISCLEKINKSI